MGSSEYRTLLDSFWKWRLTESPEFASMCGHHEDGYDARLDSWLPSAFERRLVKAKEFLAESKKILSSGEASLSDGDAFSLKLLRYDLETFVEGMEDKGYVYPVCLMEGPQVEFESVFGDWIDKTAKDGFENVVKRLGAFPNQIEEKIAIMRLGMKEGRVLHAVSLTGVQESLENLAKDGSPIIDAAMKGTEGASDKERAVLRSRVEKVVNEEIRPAFAKLRDFIAKEYSPATRKDIASRSLPDGENFYRRCLRFHVSYDVKPEEVHATGLKEVARILVEMEKIAKQVGFEGSLQEFNAHLREDPQFFFKSKEAMLKSYQDLVFKRIRPELAKLFKDIPSEDKFPLKVVPTPDSQAQAPAAFYIAGTADGSRPGTFYLNLHNYEKEAKYEMAALALHEAEPGHHLQAIYSLRGGPDGNVPEFRKTLEDRIYTVVPSRFPIHTAFTEGWGLYSESLGLEMGMYEDDPYSLYGKYQMEILRSARCVVDTGMHWLGWSRDKAVQYLVDNTAMSQHSIEFEINRYVTWPGQACAYKIGEIALREMRDQAQDKLAAKFDVRDFHSVLLETGFASISEHRKRVEKYICDKLSQ